MRGFARVVRDWFVNITRRILGRNPEGLPPLHITREMIERIPLGLQIPHATAGSLALRGDVSLLSQWFAHAVKKKCYTALKDEKAASAAAWKLIRGKTIHVEASSNG